MDENAPKTGGSAPVHTSSNVSAKAVRDVSAAITALVADFFALYLKTKNFHWHVSGPHFRDYHMLLDEHATQILAAIDPLAERVRKLGGTTLRSVSHVARLQRVIDNDAEYVPPREMMAELREDNVQLAARLRDAHELCDELGDVAAVGLIDNLIDSAEGRAWSLREVTLDGNGEQ